MKIRFTLFALLLMTFNLIAQDNKLFPLRFSFRHADTARAALRAGSVSNTSAMVYNTVTNEMWMSSSSNDTILRFSVPRGQYLGAFTVSRLTNGNTTRFIRSMTVKDGFIWAANNTDTIRKLDPVTGQEVARFNVPRWMATNGATAMISYDPTEGGGFWIGNSSPSIVRKIDTTFTTVRDSMSTTTFNLNTGGFSGMVFDNISTGGPFMWFLTARHPEFPDLKPSFPTNSSASAATIMQVSMATRNKTGVYKTVMDDFDFILNVNQSGRSITIARIPSLAKPVIMVKTGKFSGSALLASDISGITAAYDFEYVNRPDAAVDSMSIVPNFSMVPQLFARPIRASAKLRNVVAYQNSGGTLRVETKGPSGQVTGTQSVPFNLAASAFQFFNPANTFGTLQKGLNTITATLTVTDDPIRRNDTLSRYVMVTDSTLARDYVDYIPNLNLASSRTCFCASRTTVFTERPEVGQTFKLDWPATMTSVSARIFPGATGDTTRFNVYRLDANRRPVFLGQSALYQIQPSDSAAGIMTLPLRNPITIPAGQEFLVTTTEGFNAPFVLGNALGYEPRTVFVHAAVSFGGWITPDTLPSTNFFSTSFNLGLAIRPNFRLRTDLNEVSNIAYLNVSPNPTSGEISLSMELSSDDDVMVRVSSINGQTLLTRRFDNARQLQESIDLSDHPSGMYLLSVTSSTGTLTRKIVKN